MFQITDYNRTISSFQDITVLVFYVIYIPIKRKNIIFLSKWFTLKASYYSHRLIVKVDINTLYQQITNSLAHNNSNQEQTGHTRRKE